MYKVPMEIPKHCNKCPFGRHQYTKPFWSSEDRIDPVDFKSNIKNTYGYVCNIDFNENTHKYYGLKLERTLKGLIGANL